MRPIFRLAVFLLIAVVFAAPGWAGTLSISTRSTLTISGDRILLDVFVENRGSEPAYRVQAHLYIFDQRRRADPVDRLEAKQRRTFQFEVLRPPDQKGEFPFVGEILYHDAGRRPMAAFSAGTFKLDSSGGSLLSGRAPELTLTGNRSLSVTVSSRDSKPRDVLATLYLPPFLKTPQKQKQIRLKPFGTAAVDFPMASGRNAGAVTCPVCCILTSHGAGVAHAAVVETVVQVKDYQNWFVRTRWYWLGAGSLILMGWAWIGVGRKAEGWKTKKSSGKTPYRL